MNMYRDAIAAIEADYERRNYISRWLSLSEQVQSAMSDFHPHTVKGFERGTAEFLRTMCMCLEANIAEENRCARFRCIGEATIKDFCEDFVGGNKKSLAKQAGDALTAMCIERNAPIAMDMASWAEAMSHMYNVVRIVDEAAS